MFADGVKVANFAEGRMSYRLWATRMGRIEQRFGTQDRVALARIRAVAQEVEYGSLRASVDAAVDR
jgi:hypothetical protein